MSIMHNGEKVLNNLTTVPITQTIDASSTETQIPSAKAVNTLLNNKANKMAMLTSQNIDDLINEGSYYVIAATNAPDAYGWVDVLANNDYTIQLFYPSITTNCEMYIRRRREGVWGKWQRVCTTKVADVAQTNITSLHSNVTSGNIYYQVKNGICYVSLIALSIDKVESFTICEGLPRCSSKPHCVLTNGDGNTILGLVYVSVSGGLGVNMRQSGIGYCEFSYPVAES